MEEVYLRDEDLDGWWRRQRTRAGDGAEAEAIVEAEAEGSVGAGGQEARSGCGRVPWRGRDRRCGMAALAGARRHGAEVACG